MNLKLKQIVTHINDLNLNPKKCKLLQFEVKILGMDVSSSGIQIGTDLQGYFRPFNSRETGKMYKES